MDSIVTVRHYCHPDDLNELRRVFILATDTGPGSPMFTVDTQIASYIARARRSVTTTFVLFAVGCLGSVLRSRMGTAYSYLVLVQAAAGLSAGVSAGLLLYVWHFRRRAYRLFDVFRDDALKGDFRDIVGSWNLIVEDEGAGKCLPNGTNGFWVAEQDGKILGGVGLKGDDHDRTTAYVGRLFVSPMHQRKGIGKKLMNILQAHAQANGVKRLTLGTSPFNRSAIRMYTKQGWDYSGDYAYGGFTLPRLAKDLNI